MVFAKSMLARQKFASPSEQADEIVAALTVVTQGHGKLMKISDARQEMLAMLNRRDTAANVIKESRRSVPKLLQGLVVTYRKHYEKFKVLTPSSISTSHS